MIHRLVTGLSFSEGPRWRGDALYFSDFYTHSVHRMAPDGTLSTIATVPQQPSGLGWMPNGETECVLRRPHLRIASEDV